ncbi:MAG: tetratricopeptide (TPR) repeat protein [Halieaceae bacterium]|jgi:tetratricopeptide (TPR) repeat protein
MRHSLKQLIRSAVFLGIATVATGIAVPSASADSIGPFEPSFIKQADRALWRSEPARALEILRGGSTQELKNRYVAEILGLECRAYLQLDEPLEAREACLAAIAKQHNRGNWRYYNNLGVAELHLGNYQAAEQAFTRAASLGWVSAPRKNLSLVKEIREARNSLSGQQVAAELH